MGRRTTNEERKLKDLLEKSFDYLVMNFHKFTEATKVNVALRLVEKHMVKKVEHSGTVETTKIIIVNNSKGETAYKNRIDASRANSETSRSPAIPDGQ